MLSAIDNATRGLIALGQLPVTCGLFFSLGHSTIVIVVNIAIAISTNVYDKISGVGSVGAIVGTAVSGSFLFLIGVANSVLLWKILKQRKKSGDRSDITLEEEEGKHHNQMLMMRILGPIMTFVDRPWKMYPVGVLFGFGFDTASSIALLAISALARKDADGNSIAAANIVILPFLFTAGMTLVDSLDSILMVYSYAAFPESGWAILERSAPEIGPCVSTVVEEGNQPSDVTEPASKTPSINIVPLDDGRPLSVRPKSSEVIQPETNERIQQDLRARKNVMSELSLILTLMSILVAFSISLIEIMGLIGDNCRPCLEAAEADGGHGGGLAGKWWRGWAKANDNFGYIGAAIVGAFIAVVVSWYAVRRGIGRLRVGTATQEGHSV